MLFLRKVCVIKLYVIFLPVFQRVHHLMDFSWAEHLNGSWVFRKFVPIYTHIFSLPRKKLCSISLFFAVIVFCSLSILWQIWLQLFISKILIALLLCFLLLMFYVSWRKQVPMDSKVNLPVQKCEELNKPTIVG